MVRQWGMAGILALAGLAGTAHAAALSPDQRAEVVQIVRQALKDDPSILRDALAAMSSEDSARKDEAAASAIAAQQTALVSSPADQVVGNPEGSVTVVEFYDPRCPYCRQMLPIMAALVKADPQVRLVFKDIPILGPASVLESRALLAAQRQGGYMRLQDAIMHSSATPTPASLRAEAERLGMNGAQFDRDLADPAIQARLEENLRLAAALHVEGTPAIVVGKRMLPGAVELAELQDAVGAVRAR